MSDKESKQGAEFKQLVRLVDADIPGNWPLYAALRKIKGVSFSFAHAVCSVLDTDVNKKIGSLNEKELQKIEEVIRNPLKHKVPKWLLNRLKDYDTGEDKHLLTSDIKFRQDFDIKRLRKIKSYRGTRHGARLPVRGQRTRSHFRKGSAVGVKRKSGGKKGK